MSEPVLSIITTTSNNAYGLRLTAKSIAVQQQFTNFEWIVVDSGSTDNTAEIVGEYATENTQFMTTEDDNVFAMLNKGMDNASGRYLWFLSAGDCLSDAYVLRDIAKQIQYNLAPDFIYADTRMNGHIHKPRDASRFVWGTIGPMPARLYRKNMVAELRHDLKYPLASDYSLLLQILARAKKIFYYPRIICDLAPQEISDIHAEELCWEQYYIRRHLLAMNRFKNKFIMRISRIMYFLQRRVPFVYRLMQIFGR